MTPLRIRRAARQDMAAIWAYTARAWGHDQADAYVTALSHDIDRLRTFPEIGAPHPSRHGQFRKLVSGHHLIFYLVGQDGVDVVRVLHQRMDTGRWLG